MINKKAHKATMYHFHGRKKGISYMRWMVSYRGVDTRKRLINGMNEHGTDGAYILCKRNPLKINN